MSLNPCGLGQWEVELLLRMSLHLHWRPSTPPYLLQRQIGGPPEQKEGKEFTHGPEAAVRLCHSLGLCRFDPQCFVPSSVEGLVKRDSELIGRLLYKEGHDLYHWRTGWFTLEGSVLHFSSGDEDGEKEVLQLKQLQELSKPDASVRLFLTLTVETHLRVWEPFFVTCLQRRSRTKRQILFPFSRFRGDPEVQIAKPLKSYHCNKIIKTKQQHELLDLHSWASVPHRYIEKNRHSRANGGKPIVTCNLYTSHISHHASDLGLPTSFNLCGSELVILSLSFSPFSFLFSHPLQLAPNHHSVHEQTNSPLLNSLSGAFNRQ